MNLQTKLLGLISISLALFVAVTMASAISDTYAKVSAALDAIN